ncbi:hypothetical protein A8B82_12960 [Sulfitobacter sp. EhC04]|nr:hypothetical protein A8B82_12960 [Sulfitobacter sp. EhC04]
MIARRTSRVGEIVSLLGHAVGMARNLANDDIVRLILDYTVIKTRIDKKATNIPFLAAIGVRRPSRQISSQSPAGQWTGRKCGSRS